MNEILATSDGSVLTLTLNRPAKMNALTRSMYSSLAEHLRRAAGDFGIRCVLIRAEGANFTAGNDINDFIESAGEVADSEGFDFLTEIRDFPKPIVAVVQGQAIGIGTTMLMHCDVVVADPTATFSMPFVTLGLVPEAGSSYLFPQLVGYQRASHIFLTGESFGAKEAVDMGLVTELARNAYERAQVIAEKISKQPPTAVLHTKALLKSRSYDAVKAVMNAEAELFTLALQSHEAREALMNFATKREKK
ncbi:MAG TPA: enoyl-CoA hydratase-related protein [Candidatus Nanopelagicaceae bacterium]|jgi:enoyl-CoA hydratase/carnithine racemase